MANAQSVITKEEVRTYRKPYALTCSVHRNVLAVSRVKGEADSLGLDVIDMCQVCLDSFNKENGLTAPCDWCGRVSELIPRRDSDEGMRGRLYNVCSDCITKENNQYAVEVDYYETEDDIDCLGEYFDAGVSDIIYYT